MKSQKIMIAVAVLIALTAGFLAYNYLSAASQTTAAVPLRAVLIAAHDIPARVKITKDMLTSVQRAVTDVDRDAVSNENAVVGSLALTSIPAGSVITASRVGKPDNEPLPVRLRPGQRALTIAIDSVRGVAGLIEPGDHVDVIAVSKTNDGPSGVTTCLHDVLVLAMGTTLEEEHNPQVTEAPEATTVTLALTSRQAELLTLADSVSQLRLALRPPGDKNKVPDAFSIPTPRAEQVYQQPAPAPVQAAPVVHEAVPAPVVIHRVVEAAPKPAPATHELVVTVIDGDHVVGSGK